MLLSRGVWVFDVQLRILRDLVASQGSPPRLMLVNSCVRDEWGPVPTRAAKSNSRSLDDYSDCGHMPMINLGSYLFLSDSAEAFGSGVAYNRLSRT